MPTSHGTRLQRTGRRGGGSGLLNLHFLPSVTALTKTKATTLALCSGLLLFLGSCQSRSFHGPGRVRSEAGLPPSPSSAQTCDSLESCRTQLDSELPSRRAACSYSKFWPKDPYEELRSFAHSPSTMQFLHVPSLLTAEFHPLLRAPASANTLESLREVASEQYALMRAAPSFFLAGKSRNDEFFQGFNKPLKDQFLPQKKLLGQVLTQSEISKQSKAAWNALVQLHANSLAAQGNKRLILMMSQARRPISENETFLNAFQTGTTGAPGPNRQGEEILNRYLTTRRILESQILVGESAGESVAYASSGSEFAQKAILRDGFIPDADRPKYAILGIQQENILHAPAYSVYGPWTWVFPVTEALAKNVTLTVGDSINSPELCSRVPFRLSNPAETSFALIKQLALSFATAKKANETTLKSKGLNSLMEAYPHAKGFLGLGGSQRLLEPATRWLQSTVQRLESSPVELPHEFSPDEIALFWEILRLALHDHFAFASSGSYVEAQVWGPLNLQDASMLIIPKGEVLSAEQKAVFKKIRGLKVMERGEVPGAPMTPVPLQ